MPGFNKQGPLGAGPMTGRQRGMCRRTEDLTLTGCHDRPGRKGAMSGRLSGVGQPGGKLAQSRRKFAQGDESAGVGGPLGGVDRELVELKGQYQELRVALDRIAAKIASLEARALEE